MKLNPSTKIRIEKFKQNKRAKYSFYIILFSYLLSLFAPILMNNIPLLVYFNSQIYFPIFQFYSEKDFGGESLTSPNYKKLKEREDFQTGKNKIIFPIIPFGSNEDNLESLEIDDHPPSSPNRIHFLGTDDRGRDILTRIFYGYRNSMSFGLILVLLELIIGTIIGGIQGYFGKWIDITVQRVIEIISSIPFLYLILIMGSFFGRSFTILLLTYASLSWIGFSYYMRGEFYKLKFQGYVNSAKVLGLPTYKILFKHILPNALTPVVTFLPFTLISSISILSALDFLGYGIPAPNPSWGELISQGRERLDAWWLITFPSFALFITVLLSAFVGEGLRDAYDSKENITYD